MGRRDLLLVPHVVGGRVSARPFHISLRRRWGHPLRARSASGMMGADERDEGRSDYGGGLGEQGAKPRRDARKSGPVFACEELSGLVPSQGEA